MSLENKKSLISDLREKLAQKQIKPGVLVERLPVSLFEDAYFAFEDHAGFQKAYWIRTVDSGEVMLYLGLEEIVDEVGQPFDQKNNLGFKFLWKNTIIYLMVNPSTFLRDFQRNLRLLKEK